MKKTFTWILGFLYKLGEGLREIFEGIFLRLRWRCGVAHIQALLSIQYLSPTIPNHHHHHHHPTQPQPPLLPPTHPTTPHPTPNSYEKIFSAKNYVSFTKNYIFHQISCIQRILWPKRRYFSCLIRVYFYWKNNKSHKKTFLREYWGCQMKCIALNFRFVLLF